jgi:hypothetical protein
VLHGETINSFKKELQMIADNIEKNDAQWSGGYSSSISEKLSLILSKSQNEVFLMLQRNCVMEKKNKKKSYVESLTKMTKSKLESDIKKQNKKSDQDIIVLENLTDERLQFDVTADLQKFLNDLKAAIESYVACFNEYSQIKQQEEKFKTKKLKLADGAAGKFETCSDTAELQKVEQ